MWLQINTQVLDIFVSTFKNIILSLDGCPWCVKAASLLEKKGIDFFEFKVNDYGYIVAGTDSRDIPMADFQERYNHFSYPMIFLDGKFVGGFSNLQELEDNGELEKYIGNLCN